MANICFLPRDTNNYIKNNNPKKYLAEFKNINKHFDQDVQTHLIYISRSYE